MFVINKNQQQSKMTMKTTLRDGHVERSTYVKYVDFRQWDKKLNFREGWLPYSILYHDVIVLRILSFHPLSQQRNRSQQNDSELTLRF